MNIEDKRTAQRLLLRVKCWIEFTRGEMNRLEKELENLEFDLKLNRHKIDPRTKRLECEEDESKKKE